MKQFLKRMTSAVFCLAFLFSGILPNLPDALAAPGNSYTLRDYDYAQYSYSFDGSYPAPFANTSQIWHEFRMQNNQTGGFSSGYCLSYGVHTTNGTVYNAMSSNDYAALSAGQKQMINYALMFGYDVGILPGAEYRDMSKYMGTQILVWTIASGVYGTGDEGRVVNTLVAGDGDALNYYNNLKSSIESFDKIPSFANYGDTTVNPAPTYTMQWNSSRSRYEVTLTDTNGVLNDFNFSMSGVTFEKNGNTLTAYTTQVISTAATSSSTKAIPVSINNCAVDFLVNSGGAQPVCTYNYAGASDPVNAYFRLKTAAVGNLTVQKASDDNVKQGFQFKVTSDAGLNQTITTGTDGKATLSNLPIYQSDGTTKINYTVSEINVPGRYTVPGSQKVQLTNGTTTVNFTNALKRGSLAVLKTSDDNLNNGRTFSVTGSNGYSGTMTTNSSGKATLSNLPVYDSQNQLIQYTVTETGTPDRYIIPKPVTVTLETDKTITANFNNSLKRGNLAVLKTSDDNLNEGRTFSVTGSNGYSGTMTTNSSGKATLSNLPVYDSNNQLIQYTVTETGTPDRYIIPKPVTVTLETDKTITTNFYNQRKTATAELVKLDGESNHPILNHDGVFTVYEWSDLQGDYIEHSTMHWDDAKQKYVTGTLTYTLDNGGKFKVLETKSPTGYYNDKKLNAEFAIMQDGEVFQINGGTVTNVRQKASITVTKQGETLTRYDFRQTEFGLLYEPVFEVQAKENATYELTALEDIVLPDGTVKYKAGELAQTVTTEIQPDGGIYARFDNLDLGKYRVREVTAPDGYFIGSNEYEIELTYKGQEADVFDTPVDSYNDRQKFKITFQKDIEENEVHPNPDAYQDIFFGVFNREPITDEMGNVLLPKDSLLEVLPVSESGQVLSKGDYVAGEYYLKELQTAEGWNLLETEYDFTLEYPAQEIPLVWVDLNEEYGVIQNTVIRGGFAFGKISSHDNRILPGAEYGVFAADESDVPESGKLENAELPDRDSALQIVTTDENGMAEVSGLPYGWYYLQELSPAEHYHIDNTRYYFKISEQGAVIEAVVSDAPIIGSLVARYFPDGMFDGSSGLWYPTAPQTGDGFPLWECLTGVGVFAVLLVIGIDIRFRDRKRQSKNKR
ncbi:MAG: hypothetical protein DBY25_04660 [Clostridiales bacterium]|nr:MAG: hypothetical protein DBY25_04660 [Clostridiales bacterium]